MTKKKEQDDKCKDCEYYKFASGPAGLPTRAIKINGVIYPQLMVSAADLFTGESQRSKTSDDE